MNSAEKGKRGERELRDVFREAGFEARRGRQYSGTPDSPDVVTSIPWLHAEAKRTERLDLYAALSQATTDAGPKVPVVFHRRSRRPWVAILTAADFLCLVRALERAGVGEATAAENLRKPEIATEGDSARG